MTTTPPAAPISHDEMVAAVKFLIPIINNAAALSPDGVSEKYLPALQAVAAFLETHRPAAPSGEDVERARRIAVEIDVEHDNTMQQADCKVCQSVIPFIAAALTAARAQGCAEMREIDEPVIALARLCTVAPQSRLDTLRTQLSDALAIRDAVLKARN